MRVLVGLVIFNRSYKWIDYSFGFGFIRNLLWGECIIFKVFLLIKIDYIGCI